MSLDLETVHQAMLGEIDDRYQKTIGFPAYDFTRAFALAVLSLDGDIDAAVRHTNVDNLTGVELDDYIKQRRGLYRKYATYAEAVIRVVTGSGTIHPGDLFSTISGVEFYATEDKDVVMGDTVPIRAYLAGYAGNVAAGTIQYMPVTIAGIAAVTNDAAAVGGYDAETDDAFRDRYYADLAQPNNGANRQAYFIWATSVDGVGAAKIFPQALGANTVEVCVLGADMAPASPSTIAAVQALIDPNKNGDGNGAAPIGAVCTVTTGTVKTINVSCTITVAGGYDKSTVTASITQALKAYLAGVAFDTSYVSYAKLSNVVNDTEGVLDYENLKINCGASNVALGDRETPQLGTVTT